MFVIAAAVIIYFAYRTFRKPSYKYWLRLIDGNEEREIPLTRIDEVNFVSVRGNIRVYKDPTVKIIKSKNRYIIYGWGIQPYYIAKDPQTLVNVGIRDLILRIGNNGDKVRRYVEVDRGLLHIPNKKQDRYDERDHARH
ncbi:hypothetical protein AVT97_gp16 [Sulfolobales Virus YNP2]|uniref:hypothetical protein n=1 Tax=Sulfolobales Virus YNP2 TaxID=1732180 RepID=UPI000705EA6E|nr:hypothetical protein AVT97_gp16 [Sulfolobales Virus YNP2]ALG97179.1 hypothetical protein [Sulfolobales Virus YNP2]